MIKMKNVIIKQNDNNCYNSQKEQNLIPNIDIHYDDDDDGSGSLLNSHTYSRSSVSTRSSTVSNNDGQNKESQKQKHNISGMSIFGFDDDDENEVEESLLLSPILADYFPTSAVQEAQVVEINLSAKTAHGHTVTTSTSTFTPPKKSSSSNYSLSFSSSASKRIQSSARLRRRRDILFSSPANIIREEESEEENNNTHTVPTNGSNIVNGIDNHLDSENSNLLLGALDTSLCPSLGLGSSISGDNEDGGEERRLTAEEQLVGGSSGIEVQGSNCSYQANETNEVESDENKHDSALKYSNETFGENDSRLSLSSSLSKGIIEELDYTMSTSNNDLIEKQNHIVSETNENDVKQSQYNFLTYNNEYQEREKVQQQQQEGEENRFDEKNQSNDPALSKTPTRGDSANQSIELDRTPPRSSLNLTPKLKDAARQTLTPVLEALRSKLRRDKIEHDEKRTELNDISLDNGGVVESGVEGETDGPRSVNANANVNADNQMNHTDKKVSFMFKSPPTQKKSELSTSLSITPVLKSLRSKLYQGLNNESFNTTPSSSMRNYGRANILSNNDMSRTVIPTVDATTEQSPVTMEMTNDRNEKEIQEKNEAKTPVHLDNASDGLSLTPALKALRSKILGTSSIEAYSSQKFDEASISPISIGGDSPNNTNYATPHRGSLFSPPVRIPNKTPKSASEMSRNNKLAEGDDSYLAQPKDLSSAKKNLNAQSSALVERLRGAAQKRMVNLTQKRDSLAAKESVRKDSASKSSKNKGKREGNIEQKRNEQITRKSTTKNQFKARPMPSTAKSDVPAVAKKSLTKPISPKLGKRLPSRSKSRRQGCDSERQENDPFYVPPFTARPLPASVSKGYDKQRSGVPNVKRRPLTKPISPYLGMKRNTMRTKASKSGSTLSNKQPDSCYEKTNESQTSSPIDPLGIDFLSKTPVPKGHENIPPDQTPSGFHLHSTERAKQRAEFDASFALRKREREKQKRMEMDLLIKQRLRELDVLKQSLR